MPIISRFGKLCFSLTHQDTKKAWRLCQLLAPLSEALRLPYSSERATTTPRRYATCHPTLNRADADIYIPMGVYRCCCSLMNMKFLRFQIVKNKACDIRLFHIWCPTTPKEHFPSAFPSGFFKPLSA